MKKAILITLLVIVAVTVALYFSRYRSALPGVRKAEYTYENYRHEKSELNLERDLLLKAFKKEGPSKKIMQQAAALFMSKLNGTLFDFWMETDWDYNGTTEIPGTGSIACGYFVTTLLRDMGVKLDRNSLAQCASEPMIKKLVEERYIQRYSGYSIENFVASVKRSGDGIYLVGLDNHTGFIVCEKGNVTFVHSGGGVPARVLRQDAMHSGLLERSSYRVTGKLSADDHFLTKWLKGQTF